MSLACPSPVHTDLQPLSHTAGPGLGGDGNHALIKALENLAGFEVSAQE